MPARHIALEEARRHLLTIVQDFDRCGLHVDALTVHRDDCDRAFHVSLSFRRRESPPTTRLQRARTALRRLLCRLRPS